MKKLTLFSIIAIILILCMTFLYHFGDGECGDNNITLNIKKDNIILSADEIIRELAKNDNLNPQRVFASIPSYSSDLPFRFLRNYFGIEVPKFFGFHFNKMCKWKSFLHGKSYLGGVVLFDYNIGGIRDINEYKKFVDEIKNISKQNIRLIVENNFGHIKKYEIEIFPYIFADCDLNPDNYKSYCRGPLLRGSYTVSEIISIYRSLELNSTLSPNVDFQNYTDYRANESNMISIVEKMYNNNLIPVVKHYGYLHKYGNSHNKFARVNFHENEDDYIFEIYSKIENLKIPYFIMTSSHSLPRDKENPVVFSNYYYTLIKSKYPNATIMCDEIGMAPLFNYSMLERIKKLKCDGFIVHSGNFNFKGGDIISGVNSVNKMENDVAVYNILKNKLSYNLVVIK